mgnify:CR=1 FL=1
MAALVIVDGLHGLAASIHMAATGVVALTLYKMLKRWTRRPRPFAADGRIQAWVAPLDEFSFPSGHTLHAVINMLQTNYAPITELRSAVIWTKGLSTFSPDYSVEFLPSNPWIHQPFEGYDSLSPEKLLEKWRV